MKRVLLLIAVTLALISTRAHAATYVSQMLIATGPPFGSCVQHGSTSAELFGFWEGSKSPPPNTEDQFVVTLAPGLSGEVYCSGQTEIIEHATGPHCPCTYSVVDNATIYVLSTPPYSIKVPPGDFTSYGDECEP